MRIICHRPLFSLFSVGRCLGVLLGAAVAAPVHAGPPPSFAALAALKAERGVTVSALAVNLASGRVVASTAPGTRLTAASLTKLYTAAAALQHWGPGYRFVTRLDYRGQWRRGRLHGDLILVGGGDPGLVKDQLWELASRARQAGLRSVSGDLVVDESLFGPVSCQARDRCTARDGSAHAYNAPLSAAGVDFGTWCVSVAPGPGPGTRARATVCPPTPPSVVVSGTVKTASARGRDTVRLARTTEHGAARLHVSGTIPVGVPARRYYVAASRPARQSGELLRALLTQVGVRIAGRIRVVSSALHDSRPLVQIKGRTLGHEIAMMLHYSNNYMADTLALDLARAQAADGEPPTLEGAGRLLARFAARIDRDSPIRPRPPRTVPTFQSGSGLTPANRLCASDIVALLSHVYHSPAIFPAYLAGLSVPDSAPLQMLHGADAAWMQRVAVKTGSMNEPVSVLNVAGYYRTADGGWGVFAVLVNGTARHPHFPWWMAMQAVQKDVARLSEEKGVGDK